MKQTGIVLQGGGALGAYEVGVLHRLYEQPGFQPDIVAGVSIGAINAAAIAGGRNGNPVAALDAIWRELAVASPVPLPQPVSRALSVFGNPRFFTPRIDYFALPFWTSLYTLEPLRDLLPRYIDFDAIGSRGPVLLLTATNIETGTIEVFDSRRQPITLDHVLASCSLPPGFPMTRVGEAWYWDGGLFDNTPMGSVIEAFDRSRAVERELVVVNLFPAAGRVPANMPEVYDRMLEIVFSNKIAGDVRMLQRVNEFIAAMKAIDGALDRNSEIRSMPGFERLMQYVDVRAVYVTNVRTETISAPFDFSRESIEARINAGYAGAARALQAAPKARAAGGGM